MPKDTKETVEGVRVEIGPSPRWDSRDYPYLISVRIAGEVKVQRQAKTRRSARRRARKLFDLYSYREVFDA